jgi:hypothetical protein
MEPSTYVIDFLDYGKPWLLLMDLEEGESIESAVQKLRGQGLTLPEPVELSEWVEKRLVRYVKEFGLTNYLETVLLNLSFIVWWKKEE